MRILILLSVVAAGYATAQFEGGFVKILQDKRYQDGSAFGNFREQEDGIKYFEETDTTGHRRGYWEYPSETGEILRTEFIAGPGIGFRITKSNHQDITPVAKPKPQFQPPAQPRAQQPRAQRPRAQRPRAQRPRAQPTHFLPTPAPIPVAFKPTPLPFLPTPLPEFQNLFDYPGNLEFSRTNDGHRFKFTAV